MILATTIFMTARIALDRVPDAFAFFCQTSSLAEALEQAQIGLDRSARSTLDFG